MTEEDYFRKNYPDACYGDKPLSPLWDFFQDGVEFGERESEKKIAELEGKLKVETELNNRLGVAYREYEQLTKEQDEHLAELEKENAELKEKFITIKSDDVRKSKLNECKTYEDKIEYLRQVSNYALFNDDISVMLWCFCQRGEIDKDQLTKAKDHIKKLLDCLKQDTNDPQTNYYVCQYMDKAEQFLSEVEK